MNQKENFFKGFMKENPLFVSVLGMCPSLAVTTKVENAIGMGIAVFFVLTLSNFIISLLMSSKRLRELIKPVRIPVYIIVIASLVTIVEMVMHAYLEPLYQSLGVFIPLIVVNCIILGRAEAFASQNKPLDSAVDGMGMALGFTMALLIISLFREILGTGTITIWGSLAIDLGFIFDFLKITPINMFVKPVGAFLSFAFILATITAIKIHRDNKKTAEVSKQ
ncbi:MAG: electron transport complex subunit E [Candidatus Izemoplasmatales bacterium]|jgi:electron transport complex protein RnfE